MVVLIICLVLMAIPAILLLRDYYVNINLQRLALRKYQAMKALIDKLASNDPITAPEVLMISAKSRPSHYFIPYAGSAGSK